MKRVAWLTAFIALLAGIGCYTGAVVDWNEVPVAPADESSTTDAAAKKAGELPCDVAALLREQCTRCHGTKPANGALNSLVSYGDLVETNSDDLTAAEVSVARMTNAKRPMPPTSLLPAEKVAVLQTWIDKRYPSKKCVPVADAGASDASD